ncbi:replication initiation protein RepM [Acinetobacter lwoffii]|uniref:replication initiation protein RepM n=1 Tax=Acinetobacter lwoffii TaxID=28090 RepID=UPI0020985061|nr:replication initiation protein RepM [Acinetobacter lwoffii]MCO8071763.1 replication initiation protein RepM [Acinetobacter lwoffii]
MKTELVVKDNALINASYNLELAEQRLILLSIVKARETGRGITSDSRLEVHASDYMKQFNVEKSAAYEVLKSASESLFNRYFSYKEQRHDGTEFVVKSRWVSRVAYAPNVAILEVTFAPDVVPLITRLEQHFTSYQLKQVSQLTSKYAIRLYEMLIAWRNVGKCSFELINLRDSLGIASDEYRQMGHFKSRVLDASIAQINEYTDIKVTYEQQKNGRTISGFTFKLKPKQVQQEITILDTKASLIPSDLTPNQRVTFASKLSKLQELGGKAEPGEEVEAFAKRIELWLEDEKKLKMLTPFLYQVGFKKAKPKKVSQ